MKKTVFVYSLQLVCILLSVVLFSFGYAHASLVLGLIGIVDGFLSSLAKDEAMGEMIIIPCAVSSVVASGFLLFGVIFSLIEGTALTVYDFALTVCIGSIAGRCVSECIAIYIDFKSVATPQIENTAIFSLWFLDACNLGCAFFLFYFSVNGNASGSLICSTLVIATSLISAIVYLKTQYKYGHSIFHSILTGFLLVGAAIPFLFASFFTDFSSTEFTMIGFVSCLFSVFYHLIMQIVSAVKETKKPDFID